ncbi:hypothetical protein AWB77_01286 [Caballeronia fortuita]|uniref:Uncharacterized protein n=1 Tax=Caballeronia fortuita TaxID=1777138 RepID=A0A157ZZS0_9BURK|nr:hypothetical protein [Caballeronia fortuita]SAK51042.1 hypothetical protein AWB77_01286 [Caballeronia fortuita]
MSQANNVIYKGHVLSATAVLDRDRYAAVLVVRDPGGARHASGMLGEFASAIGALQYAFAYGMAEIDHRQSAHDLRHSDGAPS